MLAYLLQPWVLVLLNGASFFAGLLLGNWLAIGRDRRRERNDAAQTVRAILLKHRDPSPLHKRPTVVDLDLLERLLPWRKRRGFRKAIDRYYESEEAAIGRDSTGGGFYRDTTAIKTNLEILLRYTHWD